MRHSIRNSRPRPFSAAVLSVTALLAATGFTRTWQPTFVASALVRVLPCLAAFVAGLLNGRWSGGGGWRNGLLAGAIAGGILLYLRDDGNAMPGVLWSLTGVAVAGSLGGVVGVNLGGR